MLLVGQEARGAADHHRNLAEMDVGEEPLSDALLAALRIVNLNVCDMDINEERRRIGQITKTGIVGHHGQNRAIVLKDCRLLELGVAELKMNLVFAIDWDDGTDGDLLLATHQSIRGRGGETRRRGEC